MLTTDITADIDFPLEFTDALFALISYLITTNSGGNAVISAGMVQTFVKFLANNNPLYMKVIVIAEHWMVSNSPRRW